MIRRWYPRTGRVALWLALTVVWLAWGPAPARAEPNAPTDLKLRVVAQGVEATWQAPLGRGIIGYQVVRSLPGEPFTPVCNVPKDFTSCVDATAQPEHIYRYKVRALGPEGPSEFSLEAAAEMYRPTRN
jgi:hypothetical protein